MTSISLKAAEAGLIYELLRRHQFVKVPGWVAQTVGDVRRKLKRAFPKLAGN